MTALSANETRNRRRHFARRFFALDSASWPVLLLLVVSFALHFIFFSRPLQVVFDEVYFPRFGLAYLNNQYYFDLHPPLGKLIYFVAGWLAGLNPNFSFAGNMLPFPDASYLALRIPPRIAGTLLPLVLYGLALELGVSRWSAFVVGTLAALDNALLVISRFALLDPFLILFGFTALWCYLRARGLEEAQVEAARKERAQEERAQEEGARGGRAREERAREWRWLLAAALFGGAAFSIKWTGLSFIGLIFLLEGIRWLKRRNVAGVAPGVARVGAMALLVATIYFASYAAHFALAYRTGPDDSAMSPQFQATLAGNPHAGNPALTRPGFIGKFVELHERMFENTRKTLDPHAYASRWYDWPFMMRSVDYWAEHKDGRIAHLYFLGNPVVWWATGYCILYLLVNFPPKLAAWAVRRKTVEAKTVESTIGATIEATTKDQRVAEPSEIFIVVAYLVNMLPFVGIARIMFAYHYLPALCVALLGLGLLLDRTGLYKQKLGVGLLVLAAGAFVYFAPLTYGLPLAPADFDARFWVHGWR